MLLSLAVVPAAHAYSSPEVGMADDRILLKGTDAQVTSAISDWKGLGVNSVRIFARWSIIAPAESSKKMPVGFDPSNPSDPNYTWGPIDRAVGAAKAGGMKVYLTITGSGPLWGMSSPSNGNGGRRNPSPAKFAQFAEAVAKRYGSQVDDYIIWNEPNQVLWLQDQGTCKKKGKCVEHSPHLYRRLVLAAEPKIRAASPSSKVLIGALAPDGKTLTARNVSMRPLQFLRAFGASKFPLYLTEYAYQTNPPDKLAGVSLTLQAKYLRQGTYLAWRNSRVQNLTQYVYVDEPGSGSSWQSGLFFSDGTAKKSLAVFSNPFWAQKIKTGTVQLWGQVRPGSGARSVQLQRRSVSSWVTIQTVTTNAGGYYYADVPNAATTTYRALTPAGVTATGTIFGK
jgi:hypothetical protein